jgi:alanine racemase
MISVYDVLEACNGQLFGEPAAQVFSGFCLDVTQVEPSALFVAMRGDFGDSHADMNAAVDNGAIGLLCTKPPEFDTEGVTVIVVKDTEKALLDWTEFILQQLPVKPIIVTGTSDQKTTIEAIRRVLEVSYSVYTSPERFHAGRLNLPLMLSDLDDSHDFIIIELLVDTPGELEQAVQMIQPRTAVITQIGRANLNKFDSIDQIAAEHEAAVRYLPEDGLAVLNYNVDAIRRLQGLTDATSMTIGLEDYGPDLQAYKLVVGVTGTGFDLRYAGEKHVGKWTPLLGRHQLYSILSALAVGLHYGISIDDGLNAVKAQDPLPGRMNAMLGENGCIIIDDTHDAAPDTTLSTLEWMAEIKGNDADSRFVFVMGDLDNLGEASRTVMREIGQRAIEVADVMVTEGALAAMAGRAALDTMSKQQQVHVTYTVRDCIDALRYDVNINEQDILVVKGDVAARMELVVKGLLPDEADHANLVRQNIVEGLAQVTRPLHPSWVEVDREALANNVRVLKNLAGDNVTLMATVKADAYGHGAVTVSRVALRNGAEYLAVASVSEALQLRNAGIDAPILVLSYTPVHSVRDAIRNQITITVYDLNMVRAYHSVARELRQNLRVHVKIDTGMGRLGVMPEDAVNLFRHMVHMQYIEIEGAYTHFSAADEDYDYTLDQVRLFKETIMPIRAAGIKLKYMHAANSAGAMLGEDFHFNMVRTGILLYGGLTSTLVEPLQQLQPIMTWKTVIAQVKTLPAGHAVGYGNTYTTRKDEKVAVIPIGYADGFRRVPNWGVVLVHGQRAPIIGRVSMEKTIISVDGIDGVSIGDEVVLLGRQGSAEITAEEIAVRLGTINYEIFTNILPRVPRN